MARKKVVTTIKVIGPNVLVDGVEVVGFEQTLKGDLSSASAVGLGTLRQKAIEAHQSVVLEVVAKTSVKVPAKRQRKKTAQSSDTVQPVDKQESSDAK